MIVSPEAIVREIYFTSVSSNWYLRKEKIRLTCNHRNTKLPLIVEPGKGKVGWLAT